MYDDFTMEELAQFAQFRRKMIGKNIRLIRKVQGLSLRKMIKCDLSYNANVGFVV